MKPVLFAFIWIMASVSLQAQVAAYINFANNTADGITVAANGGDSYSESATMNDSACREIPGGNYMYLIVDKNKVPSTANNLIVKITYFGNNTYNLWFNYTSTTNNYAIGDFAKALTNGWVTTTVALTDANFKGAMNGNSDIRIGYNNCDNYIKEVTISIGALDPEAEPIPQSPDNPASGFKNKSFAGYQVWHRAGNTPADWVHWSYGVVPGPGLQKNVNVCGWPDISEYPDSIIFNTNFTPLGNGQPTQLYSDINPVVINKQFDWMKTTGLDGVAIQRFVGGIGKSITQGVPSYLDDIRKAAERTNRLFYICYDLNGFGSDILECFKNDWVYEIEQTRALTSSLNYATVNGEPVVEIWGIGYMNIDANTMLQIIQFFHDRGCYVIAGTPRDWRTGQDGETVPNYIAVYNALDCISPWTVGVYDNLSGANNYYNNYMVPDNQYCIQNSIDYLPVCFAGSGNWVNNDLTLSTTDRLGGNFLWDQIRNSKQLTGITGVYFAMFDEFEESTQLVNSAVDYFDIPTDEYFETLAKDGVWVSSDYYLRLAATATKLLRGEIDNTSEIPVPYSLGPTYFRNSFESRTTTFFRQDGNNTYTIPNKTMSIDPCFYQNAIDQSTDVSNGSCSIVQDNVHKNSGLYAAKLTGTATGTSSVYSYKTNGTKIIVKDGMKLSYYKYPANELGKNTGVDLIFSDGTRLSNSSAYVKTGGTVGAGEKVETTIGIPDITGKMIIGIALRYEGGIGSFEAYFDDIFIEDGSNITGVGNINVARSTGIYAANGNIIVEHLDENSIVSIYSTSGQLIFQQKATSSILYKQIDRGIYVVEVRERGNVRSKTVAVN